MANAAISGEDFPTRVAATFGSEDRARASVDRLVGEAGLSRDQIDMVKPHDDALGAKIEPESDGIVRTGILAHVKLGVAGLAAGLVVAVVLLLFGVDLATSNAVMTLIAFGFVGATLGLLFGGLVTARPDHQKLIVDSTQAAHAGRWTVVVHTAGDGEKQRVSELLEAESGEISRTL